MQIVAGAIGGAIGFFIGGPTGAAIGFSIGMGLAAPTQKIPGPQLGEISFQTGKEGDPRLITWGTVRPIGGNLVACSDPRIVTTTQEVGGKGGGGVETTTQTVYRTYAIGICEGPITGIRRIWRNNKLVYDARQDFPSERLPYDPNKSLFQDLYEYITFVNGENTGFLEKATIYLGDYEQLPDPTLEAIFGVGEVPAMRGTAYMVIDDEDVTDIGGAVPQYIFEVENAFEITPGEGDYEFNTYAALAGGAYPILHQTNGEGLFLHDLDPDQASWHGISIQPGDGPKNVYLTKYSTNGYKGIFKFNEADPTTITEVEHDLGELNFLGIAVAPNGDCWVSTWGGYIYKRTGENGPWVQQETDKANHGAGWQGMAIEYNEDGTVANVYAVSYHWSFSSNTYGRVWKQAGGIGQFVEVSGTIGTFYDKHFFQDIAIAADGTKYITEQYVAGFGPGKILTLSPDDSTLTRLEDEVPGGGNWNGVAVTVEGDVYAARSVSGIWKRTDGVGDFEFYQSNTSVAFRFMDSTTFIAEGHEGHERATWSLADIVEDICTRAGLPAAKIDTSLLDSYSIGFSMNNSYPASAGIEALARIFFDAANYDGVLHFIPRGGDSAATITDDELVDDGAEVDRIVRLDSITVPRVMHLEYYDIDGGLNPDKQTSDRSYDARSKSEIKTQSAVVMHADKAAAAVVVNHKVAIEEQRGGREFSLPDSFLKLAPSNIITYEGKRLRINELSVDDGFQKCKTSFDRQSAYSYTDVIGIAVQLPQTPPTQVVGDTTFQFIDSHILRDGDDKLGFYVAISSDSLNWDGALVELSLDGGTSYIDSITAYGDCIMGELSDSLADHSHYYPDEINTTSVTLLRDDMELESTDLAGMMNRVNLAIIGDELVNFADAEQAVDGDWDIGYFLRGRKGSEAVSHSIGERFVLLNRKNLFFIEADLYQLGMDLTFRITSVGASTPSTETVTFSGLSQTERSPAYLKAVRSGGNIDISWQGVGRLGGGASVAMGKYFSGYRVTVNGTAENDTTNQSMTVTDPGGDVTIQVQQINELTGAGPATEVTI